MNIYNEVLRNKGSIQLNVNNLGHEFCLLHEDAHNFFNRLRKYLQDSISDAEDKIRKIDDLTRISPDRQIDKERYQESAELCKKNSK